MLSMTVEQVLIATLNLTVIILATVKAGELIGSGIIWVLSKTIVK
jgi:hypothetical protein